jgi:hypothetical protein
MREELEFGGVTARGGCYLSRSASKVASDTRFRCSTSSATSISASQFRPFLIDTLAIRIIANSLICIVVAHSNRHSSATLKLRWFGAFAPKLCKYFQHSRGNSPRRRAGRTVCGAEAVSCPERRRRVPVRLSLTSRIKLRSTDKSVCATSPNAVILRWRGNLHVPSGAGLETDSKRGPFGGQGLPPQDDDSGRIVPPATGASKKAREMQIPHTIRKYAAGFGMTK